jgi:16S rRNA processing protein RimM
VAVPPSWVVIGRLGRPHGVRGELTVDVRTDDPDTRFAVGTALRRGDGASLVVTGSHWHSGHLLVAVEGVADRTAAEGLRDTVVYADPAGDPPLEDEDVFYDYELVGLHAELADGRSIGVLREVLHPPGGDLLAITREGGEEVLVPFVRAFVPTVDVAGGRIVLDPPEGLLEL